MNHIQSICLGAGITQIITFFLLPEWHRSERYISIGITIIITSFLTWYYRDQNRLGPVQCLFIGAGLTCIPLTWWERIHNDPVGAYLALIIIPLMLAGMTYTDKND